MFDYLSIAFTFLNKLFGLFFLVLIIIFHSIFFSLYPLVLYLVFHLIFNFFDLKLLVSLLKDIRNK